MSWQYFPGDYRCSAADQMGMLWVPVGDLPGNSWSGGSVRDNNQMGSWIGLMGQSNGDQAQILLHPRVIVAPRNNMGSGLLRSCAIGNERGITRPSDRAKKPQTRSGTLSTMRRSRILLVVGNPATGPGGIPVGFWAAELTHPYFIFREYGCEVTVTSRERDVSAPR